MWQSGREVQPCGPAWAGQRIRPFPWSSQDLHQQSSPCQERSVATAPTGAAGPHPTPTALGRSHFVSTGWWCWDNNNEYCYRKYKKYYFRKCRIHQMQTISQELLDEAKTHDKKLSCFHGCCRDYFIPQIPGTNSKLILLRFLLKKVYKML